MYNVGTTIHNTLSTTPIHAIIHEADCELFVRIRIRSDLQRTELLGPITDD